MKCAGADADTCLTDAQIATAQTIYREAKDPATGTPLYPILPGAEAVKGSWDVWLTGTDDGGKPAAFGFTWNYLANMVMRDPHLNIAKVTTADIVRGELHYAPLMDASDPDLSKFKAPRRQTHPVSRMERSRYSTRLLAGISVPPGDRHGAGG